MPLRPHAWALGSAAIGIALGQGAFRDPAPPAASDPPGASAPTARKHPRVTRHASPKPLPKGARTQDWETFLGPSSNMVSGETKLLASFPSAGPKLLWELETGAGYSAPAVSGDRLIFVHRMGDEEIVECLHPETGELYWSFSYPTDFSDRYGYNNGPRASPVIDDGRVYVRGAEDKLHCLRLTDGALLWRRDLRAEFQIPQDFFGTASTPLVEGDRLIVQLGAPGGPTVAAFAKRTGEMSWGAGREWGPSYASPVAATVRGERRVFVFAGGESRPPSGGLLSIDPSNGTVDFAFPWRSRSYESVNASTPVVLGDRVLISASYRTGAAMLRVEPDFSVERLWTSADFDLHWTTPIEHEGVLYGFAGRNEPDAALLAVDVETGRTVWRQVLEWDERIEWNGRERAISESPYRGFLLKVDGGFLALGEHGHLLRLDLSRRGPKVLSRAKLFLARETWTPPALARGLLYVCQNSRGLDGSKPRLLAYDLRAD